MASAARKLKIAVAATATAVLLWYGPTFALYPPLARHNTSPSVPLGWWVYSAKWPPAVGDIVMMRRPPGFKHNWLLKRVQGTGGDRFCWRASELRHYVNDRPMQPVHPLAIQNKLPIWRGCRTLEADEVVGFGDDPLAYGSAYFGPVKLSRLWGVYAHR